MIAVESTKVAPAMQNLERGHWICVMDLENAMISHKKAELYFNFKTTDNWIQEKYSPLEKLAYLDISEANGSIRRLSHLGWTLRDVFTKDRDKKTGKKVIIRNAVDNTLALDTLAYAFRNKLQGILLIGGDGDYIHLVRLLKQEGIYVAVAAIKGTFSKVLRNIADEFFYLDELATPIKKRKGNFLRVKDIIAMEGSN
jgi:uncharacterized LabA/DUF88 family protein